MAAAVAPGPPMPHARRQIKYRPRELRHRVVMPARLRSSVGWTDACILNVSSRGLMIHSARAGPSGSIVELWRGDIVIVARVVWQNGARAGLQSDDAISMHDILSRSRSDVRTPTATERTGGDSRSRPRSEPDRRQQGRMIEFGGIVVIGCALAALTFELVERAVERPLARIGAALGS
jgi:hypothetical protein